MLPGYWCGVRDLWRVHRLYGKRPRTGKRHIDEYASVRHIYISITAVTDVSLCPGIAIGKGLAQQEGG